MLTLLAFKVMSNPKTTIFLSLFLCLTGCSWQDPVAIYQKWSERKIHIASDIPASTMTCIPTQTSKDSELAIRENINTEVTTAFPSGNFTKLEKSYDHYRQRTSRTPSGVWKLWFFYNGITFEKLYNFKDQASWKKVEDQALKWIDQYPESPAPYIFYSKLLISHAFDFRGRGYSRNVSPNAWKPFHQNIALARAVLEKNKEFTSNDPEWYATMVEIAKLQAWPKQEVKDLLREALDREPYYHGTYFAAFSYTLPKWSGRSLAETEQFVNDAVTITRKCEGQGMYARLYWSGIRGDAEFTEKLSDPGLVSWGKMQNVNWEKMSQGFEDIIARHPDPWNLNNYANFACFARDKAKTKALFKKINGKTLEEPWKYYPQVDLIGCEVWSSRE
jgi:hypothetical protein